MSDGGTLTLMVDYDRLQKVVRKRQNRLKKENKYVQFLKYDLPVYRFVISQM